MIVDQGDPFKAMADAEKRAAASGMGLPGPRFMHVTTESWYWIVRERTSRTGVPPLTREQTTQWLIDSPLATYLGDGWWQLVSKVRRGACTRWRP